MSWKTLVRSLGVFRTFASPPGDVREVLESLVRDEPDIYWYPGSAGDLMPLALDAPNNPTGKRLFPLAGARQERKLILWMNDYLDAFLGGPTDFKIYLDERVDCRRFNVEASPVGKVGRFVVPTKHRGCGWPLSVPMAIFQVRVCSGASRYKRPKAGDLYTVIFSAAESELLLRHVFKAHGLQIRVVALQRQGEFSCQRSHFESGPGFEQYRDIPRLLRLHERTVGRVEAFLVDHDVEIPGYHPLTESLPLWGTNGTRMWVPNESRRQ